MREIRFRRPYINYDGTFNKFTYWGQYEDGLINPEVICGCAYDQSQQFVNIQDIEGNYWYEGDIISNGYTRYIIVWYDRDSSFKAKEIRSCSLYTMNSTNIKECILIGNIYQNPELLK